MNQSEPDPPAEMVTDLQLHDARNYNSFVLVLNGKHYLIHEDYATQLGAEMAEGLDWSDYE